jgi:diguanylate cyclase (GGDEF)-like protein
MNAYADELAKTAVSAYAAALETMGNAGAVAIPDLGADLQARVESLKQALAGPVTMDRLADTRQAVDVEFGQWAESAAQYSKDKAKEVREIMVAVASAAAAIGQRDQRYASQFSGLTARLQSIAKLGDLSSIRKSVLASANELQTAAAQMTQDGEESISQLRAEVASYRSQLEQSRRREAADPLTGLANRREVEHRAEERIAWKQNFCLAVLDIDGFKLVNDAHGHVAGDNLLKKFADELQLHVRSTDVVGRWGGDEFVVIVDADLAETEAILERLRGWVSGEYQISGGRGDVTLKLHVSLGVAEWDGKEELVELVARADHRMYAEKPARAGKPAYAQTEPAGFERLEVV